MTFVTRVIMTELIFIITELAKREGGSGGHHQLGDYDSTEIHNHLFGKEENTEMCQPAA